MSFFATPSNPCLGCGLDKTCISPKMQPSGSEDADIYVLGEAPLMVDDEAGELFTGQGGQLLKRTMKEVAGIQPEECRFNNSINCWPPYGRWTKVADKHINLCRNKVLEDIDKVSPKVLIIMGNVALKSIFDKADPGIGALRGRAIPWKEKNCWVVPTFPPFKIAEAANLKPRQRLPEDLDSLDCYNDSYRVFKEDLKLAKSLVKKPLPKQPKFNIVQILDYKDVLDFLDVLEDEPFFCWDWETYGVKPYLEEGVILTVAFTFDGKIAYAFPISYHPFGQPEKKHWTDAQEAKIKSRLAKILSNDATKLAHSLVFEAEWTKEIFGVDLGGDLEDLLLQSYVLDERNKVHGLEFIAFNDYGILWKEKVSRYKSQMNRYPLDKLLEYNAEDTIYTFHCHRTRKKRLAKSPVLQGIYKEKVKVSKAIYKIQHRGAIANREWMKDLKDGEDGIEARAKRIAKGIHELKEVKDFKRKHGRDLGLGSNNKDIPLLLFEDMGLKSVKKTPKGKPAVDKEVLGNYADKGVKFCEELLKYREYSTLLSKFDNTFTQNVFPDGKYHTNFNQTFTTTGRLSSNSPNLQNIDKRKHPEVRGMIKAPDGHVLFKADYGQLEARIIAMASKDEHFVKVIKEGYDIHAEKAKEIFGETNGQLRQMAKNAFVFPSFYGAGAKGIGDALGISPARVKKHQEKLWKEFPGVKEWHKDINKLYNKHGYVETLFGFRRRAPLSYTERINCVDAETEILTLNGWKHYTQLKEGEQILTKNPISEILEWKPIKRLHIYKDYKGELVNLESKSFSALVTLNHRWLIQKPIGRKKITNTFIHTSEFFKYKKNSLNDFKIHKIGIYEGVQKNPIWKDNEIALCGWALTDGHYVKTSSKNNKKQNNIVNILIVQSIKANPDKVSHIDNLLSSLGLFYSRKISKEDTYITWTLLTRNDFITKITSYLPERVLTSEFLLSLTKNQLDILYTNMMMGDGTLDKLCDKEEFCAGTKEKADMFLFLLALLGKSGSVKHVKKEPKEILNTKYKSISNKYLPKTSEYWVINVNKREFIQVGHCSLSIMQGINTTMWCPTVENETFFARRKGKMYISGNSPIQGTAADIVNYAMRRLVEKGYWVAVNVHDELVTYLPEDNFYEGCQDIVKTMTQLPFEFLNVPLEVDGEVGYNWYETVPLEDL